MVEYVGSQQDFMKIPVLGFVPESSSTAPTSPVNGQLWNDTTNNVLKRWNGSVWVEAGTAVSAASESTAGIAEIATQTETNTGTDDARIVTPLKLATRLAAVLPGTATTSAAGVVELATTAETTTGTDTTRAVTPAGVAAAIAALVAAAPGTLDTLNELAVALGNDPNFATTITAALAGKQPLDADLTAIAALASAADKMLYATGSGTWALTNLPSFARTLLANASSSIGARDSLDAPGRYESAITSGLVAGTPRTITHNLNTFGAVASFRLASTGESIRLAWSRVDGNSISVTADVAFAANAVRVTVVG